MIITRQLTLTILKYINNNPLFNFPFDIMSEELNTEDEDFIWIDPIEDFENLEEDEAYQHFEIWWLSSWDDFAIDDDKLLPIIISTFESMWIHNVKFTKNQEWEYLATLEIESP